MSWKAVVRVAIPILVLLAAGLDGQIQKPPDSRPDLKPKPLPDLVVVSIDFKDYKITTGANGVKRGSFIPSVTYKNQGSATSGSFQLAWEHFNYGTNSWQYWLQSAPLTNNLAAGQSFTEGGHLADEFGWNIGSVWPKFRCRLDIGPSVTESNENNNSLEKTFSPLTLGPSPRTPIIKK